MIKRIVQVSMTHHMEPMRHDEMMRRCNKETDDEGQAACAPKIQLVIQQLDCLVALETALLAYALPARVAIMSIIMSHRHAQQAQQAHLHFTLLRSVGILMANPPMPFWIFGWTNTHVHTYLLRTYPHICTTHVVSCGQMQQIIITFPQSSAGLTWSTLFDGDTAPEWPLFFPPHRRLPSSSPPVFGGLVYRLVERGCFFCSPALRVPRLLRVLIDSSCGQAFSSVSLAPVNPWTALPCVLPRPVESPFLVPVAPRSSAWHLPRSRPCPHPSNRPFFSNRRALQTEAVHLCRRLDAPAKSCCDFSKA